MRASEERQRKISDDLGNDLRTDLPGPRWGLRTGFTMLAMTVQFLDREGPQRAEAIARFLIQDSPAAAQPNPRRRSGMSSANQRYFNEVAARGFLVKYYGTGRPASVEEPMPTLTTKDRVALVRPVVIDGKFLDIRLRMIQPHELQGAMGFPKSYDFAGTKTEVVRQIGNAVEVNMARALCRSLLSPGPRTLGDYAS